MKSLLKETMIYQKLEDNAVKCGICPNLCIIKPGKRGRCKTRENVEGVLYSLVYSSISAMAVDPIEKKPLFHFYPGSTALSISTVGCTFHCLHCQNWTISQAEPESGLTREFSPEEIVSAAKNRGSKSIAYTYNEPLVFYEFVYDTAKIARKNNIKNVLVTNGYATLKAIENIAPLIDAANIDVKAMTEKFYKEICGGSLQPVLDAIVLIKEKNIHLEITNLIIPQKNDSVDEITKFVEWVIENLGLCVPVHFSRFHPQYKMQHLEPTPISTVVKAREIAQNMGLHYVYCGNIPGQGENTYCPSCKQLIIGRWGYTIEERNLTKDNTCTNCGTKINIVGECE
ncbi:MAG: AmmeMemoRadiSam system radical SAM enzyme [Candidatus Jordarchaeum sp.]|uniref:AmmeMemoRadiSam system radical SAM enzyme n=1 Tax=Candidatus Jordarchaeum sp. TaxID=2823881 RepID=UPI00404951D2